MDPSATPVEEEEEEEEEWMVRKSALPPPPPFLVKTYAVVEDPATEEVISWNEDGTAFVVWQPAEFARDLLPKLFKHCNFSSFVRQLNTYGFRKVATGRWEFCNKMFRKGERELLCKIRRKKAWSQSKPQASDREDQRSSLTSSFSGYSSLLDENKRLKKENGLLSSELAKTKTKCKELLELVESYKTTSGDDDDGEEEDGLKLFGVKLE